MRTRTARIGVTVKLLFLLTLIVPAWSAAQAAVRLSASQTLTRGQSLYSPNGQYRLILQQNVVLYTASGAPIWDSKGIVQGAPPAGGTGTIKFSFATVKHEVANTYLPITEYSNTHCRRYDGEWSMVPARRI